MPTIVWGSRRPAAAFLAMLLCPALGLPARAQGAAPAPATPPVAAALAEKKTGAAAWAALVGNTISGSSGAEAFTEFFEAGGGVKYVDKNGPSAGTWALQGAKVCFDFPDDDDRTCSAFEVTGSTGTAVDDDGTTARFDILTGNAKGL